jgi:hypothetical protein
VNRKVWRDLILDRNFRSIGAEIGIGRAADARVKESCRK